MEKVRCDHSCISSGGRICWSFGCTLQPELSHRKYHCHEYRRKILESQMEDAFPKVKVTHLKKKDFDHGGTRRAAAKLSDADIMVFMTSGCRSGRSGSDPNLIRPLQENPKVGAAFARQLAREDCAYLEKYTVPLIIRTNLP